MSSLEKEPDTSKTIQLADGRTLGYAEYGVPDGKPMLYFHGHPGARVEAQFLAPSAQQAGVRLIGIARPGMGLSTFKRMRRVVDWPNDVVALADRLDLDRFAVVGLSGGSPYALACAYTIPDRLTTCGLIAGVGHLPRMLAFLSIWLPWLLLPIARHWFRDQDHAIRALLRAARRWPEADRRMLLVPGMKELLVASLVEGLRQGAKGPAYDGMVLGRAWGFKLEEIRCPTIYLWHGERDQEVPVAQGRAVAAQLAHCTTTYYPHEGYLSVIVNHAEEIVQSLSGKA